MKYKLLITGKNPQLFDIFFTQLDNDFEIVSSSLYPKDIERHLRYFEPDVFVYCASDEAADPSHVVAARDMLSRQEVPFILAGTENHCGAFERSTPHMTDLTIIRLTPFTIKDKIMTLLEQRSEASEAALAYSEEILSNFSAQREDTIAKALAAAQKEETAPKKETPVQKKETSSSAEKSGFTIPKASDRIFDFLDAPEYTETLDLLSSPTFMKSLGLSADDCIEEPVARDPKKTSSSAPAPTPAPMPGNSPIFRKHVLVIDDDPQILKLIKEHLHEKYEVATAINGKIAMKFLENKRTDLILLDYEMPDENGAVVMEKLRAKSTTRFIPVIFLTGVADRDKIKNVLALKPQNYLLKPIDRAKLLDAITKVIG